MMKKLFEKGTARFLPLFLMLLFINNQEALAVNKVASTGNWGTSSTWSPSGIPNVADDVTIPSGVTVTMNVDISVRKVTVNFGGRLILSPMKKLTLLDDLINNGTIDMNGGDLTLQNNKNFVLGPNSFFTWNPFTNTVAGASLFSKGNENFDASSTLIISKWYDYNVPLADEITSHFGNLRLNSIVIATIMEWDQKNTFSQNQVRGTLTVDQGWITLDKSGQMNNITIGNIVLLNTNSTLYLHNGSHTGTIKLNTNNINNNGGTFYGIYNGNGNLDLNLSGSFTNSGNVKLVYNDGLWNVGNNKVKMTIASNYSQNLGDFRGIYNLSNTISGTFNFDIDQLVLTGGIFFGSYGINTNADTCFLFVRSKTLITFSNAADKFRGIGLSALSSTSNQAFFSWTSLKDIIISGNANAEVTSSSARGAENIYVGKDFEVYGCNVSFNFGAAVNAHPVTLDVLGKILIKGGTLNLSRLAGVLNISLGDVEIVSGTMNLKNDNGLAFININGLFNQTGGTFNIKSNAMAPATQPITLTFNGEFVLKGGTFSYDDNANGIQHIVNINCLDADFAGGIMVAPLPNFGILNYTKLGLLKLKRSSSSALQNIKQNIKPGCQLDMNSGNFTVSSSTAPALDFLVIENEAQLNLGTRQIVANTGPFSGMTIAAGGRLTTAHTSGLYNGTTNAAISSNGNLNFHLDPNSIVEYRAMMNQTITGLNVGNAITNDHKYGILEINQPSTFGAVTASPIASNVFIRTRLILKASELNLNGQTVTIENGNMDAITRVAGYIRGESSSSFNPNIIVWKNLTLGNHIVPFGKNATTILPVTINVTNGAGNDMSISTRATTTNNTPLSLMNSLAGTTASALLSNGVNIAVTEVLDRYWVINAQDITANVTFTYDAVENTINSLLRTGKIAPLYDDNGSYELIQGSSNGVIIGQGTVTTIGVNRWGNFVLASTKSPLPIQLLKFTAVHNSGKVNLDWITATETNNDFYTIEKSKDGKEFSHVAKVKAAGNSNTTKKYSTIDSDPYTGVSYYRLKQTDYDGQFKYSDLVSVNIGVNPVSQMELKSVSPNPFSDRVDVRYSVVEAGEMKIQVYSLRGQLMVVEKFSANKGMNEATLMDLEQLAPGTYILNMVYNGISVTHKIIKN